MFNLDNSTAEKLINGFQIPVKPEVLAEVQEEQAKPYPSPNVIAKIIAKDVALSAAVLKLVNSPIFGLTRRITDISQSVILLGRNNVSNLVTFFELKKSFHKKSSISHEKYWDLAMETANVMMLLLELLGTKIKCAKEDAYAFGLFRDCGIPSMAMKYSDYKTVLIEVNKQTETVMTKIEDTYYQTNHASVGYFVARSWHLPKSLCELILRHHEPEFLLASDPSTEQKDLYALAKLAGNILSQYHAMKDEAEWNLVKESVLGHIGLGDIEYNDIREDIKETFMVKFGG
ncbi:MAG: HDOD domain-containing protein [Pseudomonadota bacterium]|nr:HDOD domain-containing protein [Pseudomonadota bacterium]